VDTGRGYTVRECSSQVEYSTHYKREQYLSSLYCGNKKILISRIPKITMETKVINGIVLITFVCILMILRYPLSSMGIQILIRKGIESVKSSFIVLDRLFIYLDDLPALYQGLLILGIMVVLLILYLGGTLTRYGRYC
jgi:hypothetical protein